MQSGNVNVKARCQPDRITTKPGNVTRKTGPLSVGNTYVNRHPSKPCRMIVKMLLEIPGERI